MLKYNCRYKYNDKKNKGYFQLDIKILICSFNKKIARSLRLLQVGDELLFL